MSAPAAAAPGMVTPLVIAVADDAGQTAAFVSPAGDRVVVADEGSASRLLAHVRRDGVVSRPELLRSSSFEVPRSAAFAADGGMLTSWGVPVGAAAAQAAARAAGGVFLPTAAPSACGRFNAVVERSVGKLLSACSTTGASSSPPSRRTARSPG